MERTYNEFVDNGLYILSYYLNKEIEDITSEDIGSSTELMANILADYLGNDLSNKTYLAKNSYSSFMNSKLTQIQNQKDKFHDKNFRYNVLLDELNKISKLPEKSLIRCEICNKIQVEYNNEISKKHMVGICGETTSNLFNNMHNINICPHCIYLSYLSVLNIIRTHGCVLINSNSNVYMKKLTSNLQNKLIKEFAAGFLQYDEESYIDLIINVENKKRRLNEGEYISVINFQNGQNNYYEIEELDNEKLLFLKKIGNLGIRYDLNKITNVLYCVLHNIVISKKILEKLEKKEIIISNDDKKVGKKKVKINTETFELIVEAIGEYEMKDNYELIKTIVEKLRKNYSNSEINKKLNLITNVNKFKDFLVEETENIALLESIEQMDCLSKKWISVMNYIKLENAIRNNKEKENNK